MAYCLPHWTHCKYLKLEAGENTSKAVKAEL